MIGLGGGALWVNQAHGLPPGGGGGQSCGRCNRDVCELTGSSDDTCKRDCSGGICGCVQVSGCARTVAGASALCPR
jgi:hypothetical protein